MPTPTAGWAATPCRGGRSPSSARRRTTTWIGVGTMPFGYVTGTYVLAQRPAGDQIERLADAVDRRHQWRQLASRAGQRHRLHRRRGHEVRVVDPGPMRLTLKGVAPMSGSTGRRQSSRCSPSRCWRARAPARVRRRSAGPTVAGSAPPSAAPTITPSAVRSSSVIASLSATEPPAASIAVEGGDPVTGQLGTFTWGDGGSDSPWLPWLTDRRRHRRALDRLDRGSARGGHLVRQTYPRGVPRVAPGRPVSGRVARRSPSTRRKPGRGRSR